MVYWYDRVSPGTSIGLHNPPHTYTLSDFEVSGRVFYVPFFNGACMTFLAEYLYFGNGNKKLNRNLHAKTSTFSLPAGFTCPGAHLCLAKADPITGKITKGDQCLFTCFAARDECIYPSVRRSRWRNYELCKSLDHKSLVSKIHQSIAHYVSRDATHIRWHVSGDFFSAQYLKAVMEAAKHYDNDLIFYAYSKALHFFNDQHTGVPLIERPPNFRLTASWGGIYDFMIDKFPDQFPRSARVVNSRREAEMFDLPIDEDDSLASGPIDQHFALFESIAKRKETAALRKSKNLALV